MQYVEGRGIQPKEERFRIGAPALVQDPLALGAVSLQARQSGLAEWRRCETGLCWAESSSIPRPRSTSVMRKPHRFSEPQSRAIEHQDQCAQHPAPDEAALVGCGQSEDPPHIVMAEDVGYESQFLDRRQAHVPAHSSTDRGDDGRDKVAARRRTRCRGLRPCARRFARTIV